MLPLEALHFLERISCDNYDGQVQYPGSSSSAISLSLLHIHSRFGRSFSSHGSLGGGLLEMLPVVLGHQCCGSLRLLGSPPVGLP